MAAQSLRPPSSPTANVVACGGGCPPSSPIALVVALFPFTFAHLTKPEAELLSTFAGGAVYGWLTWRTRSVLWGALAHVYIVTLVIIAAGESGVAR